MSCEQKIRNNNSRKACSCNYGKQKNKQMTHARDPKHHCIERRSREEWIGRERGRIGEEKRARGEEKK
jgi:hypothetical protein